MATLRSIYRKAAPGWQDDAGVLLGPVRSLRGRKHRRFRIDWVVRSVVPMPSLDPVLIVEVVSELLLKIHRDAIQQGVKADGSGPQPPLSIRTLYSNVATTEVEGRRVGRVRTGQRERKSQHRGYRTGFFADNIQRSKIRVRTGTKRKGTFRALKNIAGQNAIEARAVIGPPPGVKYASFLAYEAKRDIEYFYVEGKVEQAVDRVLRELWDMMVAGNVREGRLRRLTAREAKLALAA